jgi:nitronate monooxygenase
MNSQLPIEMFKHLKLPLVGAPLFLVSGPELVIAQCKAGIVGTFPALNARPIEQLDAWIERIKSELASEPNAAPFGVNVIVHRTNPRVVEDITACVRHKVPIVITSVGEPSQAVAAIHSYGGLVFHDVISLRHARKAAAAGVDGLILVCAGAGGHGGTLNPFAFVTEVREFYAGPILLSGSITRGNHIRAALAMGADLAYMGTAFIATAEAHATDGYKQMIVDSTAADIVYTPAFTGVNGNYLRGSISNAGLDPDNITGGKSSPDLALTEVAAAKAWKEIWGAGQGVGAIHDIPTVAELVARLAREYDASACL